MDLARLKIDAKDPTSRDVVVTLDGVDITKGLNKLVVTMEAGTVNTAVIELRVYLESVDLEVLASVHRAPPAGHWKRT